MMLKNTHHFPRMSTFEKRFTLNLMTVQIFALFTSFRNYFAADQTSENFPNPHKNMTVFNFYNNIFKEVFDLHSGLQTGETGP